MEKVRVDLGPRSYDICIGSAILGELKEHIRTLPAGRKVGIVTNPVLRRLYGEKILADLKDISCSPLIIEIPAGERYKTLKSVTKVYDMLLRERFERNSLILSLGGGVIGDLAGFVAATYLRGVPYLQVPTSLVAQVDSSVGGKTGVNHPLGKNMIGAFYQPILVWIDVDLLKTLPRREFISGLAEVIKYGVIADRSFFEFLEENHKKILSRDKDAMIHVVKRSCEIKAMVVSADERESGLRAILNFGHTVGHGIETLTGYRRFKHGEAVAIGMVCAARLANILGMCDSDVYKRIKRVCRLMGLRITLPEMRFEDLWIILQRDKKVINEQVRFILPTSIGEVKIIQAIDKGALHEAIQLCYINDKF